METLIKLVYTGIMILHKENMNLVSLISIIYGDRETIKNVDKWISETDKSVRDKLNKIMGEYDAK